MGIKVLGTGRYIPSIKMSIERSSIHNTSNNSLTSMFDGTRHKFKCDDYETATYIGAKASIDALQSSEIDPGTIDAVLCYSSISDNELPKDVYGIINQIGCNGALAWSFDTACASFLSMMNCAKRLLMTGFNRVLVISAISVAGRAIDPNSTLSRIIGDGAAAMVLEMSDEKNSIFEFEEFTDSAYFDFMKIGNSQVSGNHEFATMTKDELIIKRSLDILPETAKKLLTRINVSVDEITWLITHQPGTKAIQYWTSQMDIPLQKNLNTYTKYGNMSASNLPITLDYFTKDEIRIKRGDLILLMSAGAGIHGVSGIFRY